MQLLTGLGLAGYRSFGSDSIQLLSPLGRVNLIAGQNNSGKSNVLRFIQGAFAPPGPNLDIDLSGENDRPLGEGTSRIRLAISRTIDDVLPPVPANAQDRRNHNALRTVLERIAALQDRGGDLWWELERPDFGSSSSWQFYRDGHQALNSMSAVSDLNGVGVLAQAFAALGRRVTSLNATLLVEVMNILVPDMTAYPRARTITAHREIRSDGSEDLQKPGALSGLNLIQRLFRLQQPDYANRAPELAKFRAVEEFARSVLDDQSIRIEVPYTQQTIHVTRGSETLPLENLGTGIQEVLILAVGATVVEDSLLCIEEPEIHLHPILQRKLIGYLAGTSNQYFVATHSAQLLDSGLGQIFHAELTDGRTSLTHAALPRHRAALVADLGYRASDLVQANAIIWVEGPSDRIYLRHWIGLVNSDLVEGIHYSIMFYGGRLLAHLSANDPDLEDFISLRHINRNMVVLIDSDKASSHARLSATKVRVRDEFNSGASGGGHAWISAGYTIENYVPDTLLASAIARAHPSTSAAAPAGRYENPLSRMRLGIEPDKVSVARAVAEAWIAGTPWPLDLLEQTRKVVNLIESAND